MYKLSKFRSKKDRKDLLRLYENEPSSFFRLTSREFKNLKGKITDFCELYLKNSGLDGYVVGLSGGLDSSVVIKLLSDAVLPKNVHGVLLPSEGSKERDIEDALALAERLGIETYMPPNCKERIEEVAHEVEEMGIEDGVEERQKIKRGNIIARTRMIILRDIAKAKGCLVAGTTNASERFTGYVTVAGDGKGGADIEVVYDLFKSTVRNIAPSLDIPEEIVEKRPSADLWKGQTDKKELGLSWGKIDKILVGKRLGIVDSQIAEVVGIQKSEVRKIKRRVEGTVFKREEAPYPEFTPER